MDDSIKIVFKNRSHTVGITSTCVLAVLCTNDN